MVGARAAMAHSVPPSSLNRPSLQANGSRKKLKMSAISVTPADDDDEEFLQGMKKSLNEEQRMFVEAANLDELQSTLHEYLQSSGSTQARHHRHEGVLRRTGARSVTFVNSFSEYLSAYSGIVEIVKGVDEQHGGLAYGILSTLLIVGVNKYRKERIIDDTLLMLHKEYSRLNALPSIHSSAKLAGYIREAFDLGIRFAKLATTYYSRASWRRVLGAVTEPPNIKFQKIQGEIASAVAEVEKERDHLNTERLKDVDDRSKETKRQVEDMHAQSAEHSLRQLRSTLGVQRKDINTLLTKYQNILDSVFRETPRWSPFHFPTDLESRPEYQQWATTPQSSLFLLYGKTKPRSGDCCWLSPAARDVAQHARAAAKTTAVYLCQPHESAVREVPPAEVMRDVAYQLLEHCGVRINEPSFHEHLTQRAAAVAARPNHLETCRALLEQALAPHRRACVVIDRADYIRGDSWIWLEHFVRLLRTCEGTTLQVFVVASATGNREPGGKLPQLLFQSLEERLGDRFFGVEDDRV